MVKTIRNGEYIREIFGGLSKNGRTNTERSDMG